MLLLRSPSANPYFNVALEDYLVRNFSLDNQLLLLLYENESCVMLGKNQSVYKEVNFDYLRKNDFTIARRISGGGTVYHGKGNLCFAFITTFSDEKINNYRYFNQPIVDALNKAGVPASFNQRNDIVCEGYKISGNAQFTNRKNIISHGTLLFNADLSSLNGALRKNDFPVESKSVDSVRSAVKNIASFTDQFNSLSDFIIYLTAALPIEGDFTLSEKTIAEINEKANDFKAVEWTYGRSPRTIVSKNGLTITVDKGKLIEITQNGISVFDELINQYYTYHQLKNLLDATELQLIF